MKVLFHLKKTYIVNFSEAFCLLLASCLLLAECHAFRFVPMSWITKLPAEVLVRWQYCWPMRELQQAQSYFWLIGMCLMFWQLLNDKSSIRSHVFKRDFLYACCINNYKVFVSSPYSYVRWAIYSLWIFSDMYGYGVLPIYIVTNFAAHFFFSDTLSNKF